jgi:hypothetical protein
MDRPLGSPAIPGSPSKSDTESDAHGNFGPFSEGACYYQNASYCRKINRIKVVGKPIRFAKSVLLIFSTEFAQKKLQILQEIVQIFHEVQS